MLKLFEDARKEYGGQRRKLVGDALCFLWIWAIILGFAFGMATIAGR